MRGSRAGRSKAKCTRLANPGERLTLTATPDAGAVFLGWQRRVQGMGVVARLHGDRARHEVRVTGVRVRARRRGAGDRRGDRQLVARGHRLRCRPARPSSRWGRTVTLTATPDSASGFGGWSGACAGSSPTCDVTVDASTSVGARFDAAVFLQEDGIGTRYAWGSRTSPLAIGGSYRWDRRAGASLTFGFRGTAVSLFTAEGPAMGRAKVAIDGTLVATLDGYAPTFAAGVEHRYDGLSAGHHTISITATGTSAHAAEGTRVAVDALRWGGILRKNPLVRAGAWGSVADASAGGGAYVVNDVAGRDGVADVHGNGRHLAHSSRPTNGSSGDLGRRRHAHDRRSVLLGASIPRGANGRRTVGRATRRHDRRARHPRAGIEGHLGRDRRLGRALS